jgi:hypothetical protein
MYLVTDNLISFEKTKKILVLIYILTKVAALHVAKLPSENTLQQTVSY